MLRPGADAVLHWLAVLIGLIAGLALMAIGFQAVFTLSNRDSLASVLMLVIAYFSIFPLSVLAIWQARRAAFAMLICCTIHAIYVAIVTVQQISLKQELVLNPVSLFSMLPSLLVALLLFASI